MVYVFDSHTLVTGSDSDWTAFATKDESGTSLTEGGGGTTDMEARGAVAVDDHVAAEAIMVPATPDKDDRANLAKVESLVLANGLLTTLVSLGRSETNLLGEPPDCIVVA